MFSFYGNGPQGRSFKISKVFSNYAELKNDLKASEIKDGDFVLISYGKIGTNEYITNLNIDCPPDTLHGVNYNSTFWQKVYDKTWKYNFIAQMTGNTPQLQIESVTFDKTDNANISIDNTNVDTPKLSFILPRTNYFLYGSYAIRKTGPNTYINLPSDFPVDIEKGDFYIDTVNGVLYKIIDTTVKNLLYLEFVCQLAETPESIAVEGINPYGPDGTPVDPVITRDSSRNYKYQLPKAPIVTATVNAVAGSPAVSTTYNTQGVDFQFTVPKGDKGDQGIQGPQGDSLKFIGNITNLSSFDEVTQNTFSNFSPTTTNEAVVVTIGDESRWYFKLNNVWQYTVASTPITWIDL